MAGQHALHKQTTNVGLVCRPRRFQHRVNTLLTAYTAYVHREHRTIPFCGVEHRNKLEYTQAHHLTGVAGSFLHQYTPCILEIYIYIAECLALAWLHIYRFMDVYVCIYM